MIVSGFAHLYKCTLAGIGQIYQYETTAEV